MSNTIGHVSIETPWGNAGGVLKSVEDVELMAHSGVGWMEAGSYTLEPREGSPGEYRYDPATGETNNSLKLPNQGLGVLETEIPEMVRIAENYQKGLIINVAPVSDDPVGESQELIKRAMAAGAPAVLLNASCPNVINEDGSRHDILSLCQNPFGLVLNGLRGVVEKYNQKIFVRVSPQETYEETEATMMTIRRSGVVSAVFATNSFLSFEESNLAGRSGPGTAVESRQQTEWIVKALEYSGIDTVSCSGIVNVGELMLRQKLGAVAGAGTTFFYESAEEGWSEATDRLLRQYQPA